MTTVALRRLRGSRRTGRRVAALTIGALLAGTALVAAAAPGGAAAAGGPTVRRACAPAGAGIATCFARYLVPGTASAAASAATHARALTPAGLQAAYGLPASGGDGRTVAIVDAYDNPKAESDLAIFRAKYHLPPCTKADGCFRKVNQAGDPAPLPQKDPGWGLEIALDLDAVSSVCPDCHILLVEGRTASISALAKAENTAVALGADVVSNSYGTDEFSTMRSFGNKYYNHPGVPIIVSSGDFGFTAAQFPAVMTSVIAVGGTRLVADPSTPRGWTEKVWGGAGSGCSAYIAKPAWQHDPNCLYRTVADVSADADPASGLLVSDSFGFHGTVQVGGTSLSAPLIAGMYALSGVTGVNDASALYAHSSAFHDVVGGRNGYCGGDYLCTGLAGYDAPSGVGTPDGLSGL